jgi:hypothetical protein
MMNISAFMGDGAQKEKLRQVELIGEILKESSKFESVMKHRAKTVKPIMNYWKQGKINNAIEVLNQ